MWLNDVLLGILVVIWQKESLFTLCIKFFSTDELYDLPKSGNKPGRIVGKSANFRFFRPIRRQLQSAGWYRLVGVTNYGLIIEISQNSSHLHSSCVARLDRMLASKHILAVCGFNTFPVTTQKGRWKTIYWFAMRARLDLPRFLQIWRVTIFVKMFRNIYEVLLFNRESGGKSHLRVRFGRQTTLIDNWRKSDVSCWVEPGPGSKEGGASVLSLWLL